VHDVLQALAGLDRTQRLEFEERGFLIFFFNLHSGGVESKLGPLGMSATYWPIVPAPGDCENREFGGDG
jgi:hypothetical protein